MAHEQVKKQENEQNTTQRKEKESSRSKLKVRTNAQNEASEAMAVPSKQGDKPAIQAKTAGGKRITPIQSKHQPVPAKHQPIQRTENEALTNQEDEFDDVLNKNSSNSKIIRKITKFALGKLSKKEDRNIKRANKLLKVLGEISPDRMRVVIFTLIRNNNYDNFAAKVGSRANEANTGLVEEMTKLRAEFDDPTAGSKATTPEQDKKIKGILNKGMVVNEKGETGPFKDLVDDDPKKSFRKDVLKTLEAEMNRLHEGYSKRDKMKRFGWPRYEEISAEAKRVTDSLYGHYNQGPAMTPHGKTPNLLDVHEQKYSDFDLYNLANYVITASPPKKPVYPGTNILVKHNASLKRPVEAGILKKAILDWLGQGTNKEKTLIIMRNWGGTQRGGKIYTQRINYQDELMNRYSFWKTFQTMIHEYLHSITSKEYSAKAGTLGRRKEQIYTEGGTSYFDKKAWETVFPAEISSNDKLRLKIEGGYYPYESKLIPEWKGYPQKDEFAEIVAEVGEANAMAAYFKGQTDRIGLGK